MLIVRLQARHHSEASFHSFKMNYRLTSLVVTKGQKDMQRKNHTFQKSLIINMKQCEHNTESHSKVQETFEGYFDITLYQIRRQEKNL